MRNIMALSVRLKYGCLVAALLACSFFSSCSLFFTDKISAPADGSGMLTVSFAPESVSGSESSSAHSYLNSRTVVPSLASNAKAYVIECANSGGSVIESATVSALKPHSFQNLPAGQIIVTVRAYSDETVHTDNYLVASGSATVSVASGKSAAVSVVLSYSQTASGTGSFSLTLEWPASAADSISWSYKKSDATDWFDDGNTLLGIAVSGIKSASLSKSELPSGSYYLVVNFMKGGNIVGRAFEAVNVYDNAMSGHVVKTDGTLSSVRTFTEKEIASSGTEASLLVVAGSDSIFLNLDNAHDTLSYNALLETNITVIPFVGELGQSILYSWDGADPIVSAPCTAGSPLTLKMKTVTVVADRINTLDLDVKPSNGSLEKTYTIKFRSPVYVSTIAELANALKDAPDGLLDNNVILNAHIALTGTNNWTPVGVVGGDPYNNQSSMFTGTFDGGGHTISGLNLTTTNGDAGFFAAIGKGAYITGVRLTNVSITGGGTDDGIGGLVGENYGGTITRCSVSGYVTGHHGVGGLVGNNRAESTYDFQSRISECYSTATVTATSTIAGGLVGSNWGIVENSYARSNVSAQNIAGGLVASQVPTGLVTNCYASGTVTASSGTGGLVGAIDPDWTCSASYYNKDSSGLSDSNRGTPTSIDQMKSWDTFNGWDGSVWAQSPSINSGYPYLKNLEPETVVINTPSMSGTEFRAIIQADLSADVVLKQNLLLTGNLSPIGSDSAPYMGTFNGNYKTITGLTIDVSGTSVLSGLFACVGAGAVVQNLHLENVDITGLINLCKGSLAGRNSGTILNCSSSGSVSGDKNVGGIVGINSGIVRECWSNASVTGSALADNPALSSGGLVGSNSGLVADCYARGAVSVRVGGGLAGINNAGATIRNSWSSGVVSLNGSSSSACVQGLVGTNNGTVSDSFFDRTRSSTYYQNGTSGQSAALTDIARNAIEMRTQNTYPNGSGKWDFTDGTGVWAFTPGKNGGYPHLRNTAPTSDKQIASISDMNNLVVTNLDGDFYLSSDLNFNAGAFIPITEAFTGSFNGNGKVIRNATYTASENYNGLWKKIDRGGIVYNLDIENTTLSAAGNIAAGLVCGQLFGTIANCRVSGSVSGTEDYYGGLCGIIESPGYIRDCSFTGSVQGKSYIAGIAGKNSGTIDFSSTSNTITGSSMYTSGFVGQNSSGKIRYCSASGIVKGWCSTGGLIGQMSGGTVSDCYVRGAVIASGLYSRDVGGFIGEESGGSVSRCYSAASVDLITETAENVDKWGGFSGPDNGGSAITYSNCLYDNTLVPGSPLHADMGAQKNSITLSSLNLDGTVWAQNGVKNGGYPYLTNYIPEDDVVINSDMSASEFHTLLSKHSKAVIELTADIALSGNLTPIGTLTDPFRGTFNGNRHTISGLIVNNEDKPYAGLFGVNSGIVENLKIVNPSIATTGDFSGGLAGQNNGLIRRCSVIGSKPVKAMGRLGGLVGKNTGTITESYTSIPVEATSWYVGGLVGTNGGTIIDCYATGSVTSLSGKQIGGLIGDVWSSCIVKNSYATGKVSGVDDTGGLVGVSGSSLINCFYNTTTSGMSDTGKGEPKSTADMKLQSTFSGWDFGTVWEIDTDNSDGLINDGYPYLKTLGAQNAITLQSGDMYAETLSGAMSDHSAKYTLSGDITLLNDWTPLGSGADPFTGIFNGNGFTINGLTVDHNESSAGLFGINNGTIENVNIENASIKSSSDSCGILAGQNNGVIRHCSVSGSSPVQGVIYVGGLVGINRGLISESYSTVPVLASSFSVGGLVGRNEAFISNCYATGSVTSPTRENVGGLVGHNWTNSGTTIISIVEKSFAIGKVTGAARTGGLVGYHENSTVSTSFYDSISTGMADDTGKGAPKTTIQMRTSGTYTGWDFTNTWEIDATGLINNGYPYLQYFGSETVTPPVALSVNIGETSTPVLFTNSGGITLTADRNNNAEAAYLTDKDKKLVTSDQAVLFTGATDFTIMGWFRIDSYDAGNTYLFYKGGPGVSNYGVVVAPSSSPASFSAQIIEEGGSGVSVPYSIQNPAGTWYHVAMVYQSKKVSLFVGGGLVGNITGAYGGATGPGSEFYFGAFNGAMSDLKIFNTAKNQAEIQTLMDQ